MYYFFIVFIMDNAVLLISTLYQSKASQHLGYYLIQIVRQIYNVLHSINEVASIQRVGSVYEAACCDLPCHVATTQLTN